MQYGTVFFALYGDIVFLETYCKTVGVGPTLENFGNLQY
jgi:hypothetical protein